MVASDDESSANASKRCCQVERLLRAYAFNDPRAKCAAGELVQLADQRTIVLPFQCFPSTAASCCFQCKRTSRNSDHTRACVNGELCERRANKPNSNNRDGLPGLNRAASPNIHRTAQWLSWELRYVT